MSSDDFWNQQNQVPGQGGAQGSPPPGYGQPGQYGQGQLGQGPYGQGQYGFQGTPTPIGQPGYGQQGFGNQRMWSQARPAQGLGGGIGRLLLGFLGGGIFGGRGRSRYFSYIRIAFWLIVVGICLYVGFTTHHWITTCTGDCGGGD